MPLTSKIPTRFTAPVHKLLFAGLLTCATGALTAGALAASALPAYTPHGTPMQFTHNSAIAAEQPMPPMPEQTYDASLHEGAVAVESTSGFAGIDPIITGPSSQ